MDREAWRAVIHGVAKSRTRLRDWTELNWTKFSKIKTWETAYLLLFLPHIQMKFWFILSIVTWSVILKVSFPSLFFFHQFNFHYHHKMSYDHITPLPKNSLFLFSYIFSSCALLFSNDTSKLKLLLFTPYFFFAKYWIFIYWHHFMQLPQTWLQFNIISLFKQLSK